MLSLVSVSKKKVHNFKSPHKFLDNVTLTLNTAERIAILAKENTIIDGLAKAIAGNIRMDSGYIWKNGLFSPPIGSLSNFPPLITGNDAIRFSARLYDINETKLHASVKSLLPEDDFFDLKISKMSSPQKLKFNHAVWLAIKFDCYVFCHQVIPTREEEYIERCSVYLNHHYADCGYILLTKQPKMAKEFCDMGVVYHQGKLYPFADVEDALEFFNKYA